MDPVAKPTVDELAGTTWATTNLVTVEEGRGVYLYRNDGGSPVSDHLPGVGDWAPPRDGRWKGDPLPVPSRAG